MVNVLTQNIVSLWVEWHFFDVPQKILKGWKNFLKFNLDFFSIPILLKTFFAPWRRYQEKYIKGINISQQLETLVINTFSRLIGAFLRANLLILGLLIEIFIFLIGLIVFMFWFILPIFMVTFFLWGFAKIF